MKISVDDESSFILKSNPATLGEVFSEITEYLESKQRAIQVIQLNGQNITPEDLTLTVGKMAVGEVESLKIETASLTDLVVEALDEIMEVIPELPIACHELAQILVGDSPSSCFGQFNQFLEIWDVLKERQSQVIDLLGIDAAAVRVGSVTISEHNSRLGGFTQQARGFMESSDFPALSDVLSHDLYAMAEVEETIIEALRTYV